MAMKVIGFAGYSGSGKTSLVEPLITLMRAQGLSVSVVKHAHHHFDVDHEGKDSWRHRKAGAYEVVLASDRRLALMREFPRPTELSVHDMLAELDPRVEDRKSTRLNSSHLVISYAVFCLKKKKLAHDC